MNQPCQTCGDKAVIYFSDSGRYCADCLPKRTAAPQAITELLPHPERWQDRMAALEKRIESLEKLIKEWTGDK